MDHSSIIQEFESKIAEIDIRIAELQADKAEVQTVLAYHRKQAGSLFKGNIRPPRPGVDYSQIESRALSSLVQHVLESEFSRSFTIADVMKATNIDDIRYVRSTLARLYKERKIDKVARGIYRARKRSVQVLEGNHAVNS
jgi:hypothetical protein